MSDEISTPTAMTTPDPDTAVKQGAAPTEDLGGRVFVTARADLCINGMRYDKGSRYLVDPVFAASRFEFIVDKA